MTKLKDMKPADRKKRIAKLVKNPGTRSAVADKFLSPAMLKQRQANTAGKQPIVPGGSMTVRDLNKQRDASTKLRYGSQDAALSSALAGSQRAQTDTAGWYDQYKAELAQHQANTAQVGAQQHQQLQQLGGAVTGLDQSQLNATTQASVAEAATRGTVPGAQAAVEGGQGSAVRQALLGSFGAMMAAQAGGADRMANTLTHVVAPGQKLNAMATAQGKTAKVRQSQKDLAAEKGVYATDFESKARQAEQSNVAETAKTLLAEKALGINTETTRRGQNISANTTRQGQETTRRGQNISANTTRRGQDISADTAAANRAKQARKDAKAKAKGKGPDWLPQGQTGAGLTQLQSLKSMAQRAMSGQPFEPGHAKQKRLNRHGAAAKIKGFGPVASKLKDPILITAALDAVYDNHLSPATVKALIAAGYKPSRVAQTLGVSTASKYKPKRPYKPPAKGTPAATIPGIGGN